MFKKPSGSHPVQEGLMRYSLIIFDAAMMPTNFPVSSRSNFWMLGGVTTKTLITTA